MKIIDKIKSLFRPDPNWENCWQSHFIKPVPECTLYVGNGITLVMEFICNCWELSVEQADYDDDKYLRVNLSPCYEYHDYDIAQIWFERWYKKHKEEVIEYFKIH